VTGYVKVLKVMPLYIFAVAVRKHFKTGRLYCTLFDRRSPKYIFPIRVTSVHYSY